MIRRVNKKRSNSNIFFIEKEVSNNKNTNYFSIISSLATIGGVFSAYFWFLGYVYYSAYYSQILGSSIHNIRTSFDSTYIKQGYIYFLPTLLDIVSIILAYLLIYALATMLFELLEIIKIDLFRYFIKLAISFVIIGIGASNLLSPGILLLLSPLLIENTHLLFAMILIFSGGEILQLVYKDNLFLKYQPIKYIALFTRIIFFSITLFTIIVSNALTAVKNGITHGCEYIYNKSIKIALYTENPLPLNGKKYNQGFLYDEYFLSYQDSSYYYIYNTFNEEIKPAPLIIIPKEQVDMISLEENKASSPKENYCKNFSDVLFLSSSDNNDELYEFTPPLTKEP